MLIQNSDRKTYNDNMFVNAHKERIILRTICLNLLPTFPSHMWHIFHSPHIPIVLSCSSILWSNYPWFHSMHICPPSHNIGYRVCTLTGFVVHWKMETSCVYSRKIHSLKQNTRLYSWLWSVLNINCCIKHKKTVKINCGAIYWKTYDQIQKYSKFIDYQTW